MVVVGGGVVVVGGGVVVVGGGVVVVGGGVVVVGGGVVVVGGDVGGDVTGHDDGNFGAIGNVEKAAIEKSI